MNSGLADGSHGLIDLHFHPALPWVGEALRKGAQGFRLETLDGRAQPAARPGFRLYGAAFYETYLLRPGAARERLLLSLKRFRARMESLSEARPRLILRASDLTPASISISSKDGEAFFMTVESLRYLRDPGDIRILWDLGARSLQPIHFLATAWGGSSREGILPPSPGGLTGLGREMLAEMARAGFILDISHMSYKTAEDCLRLYPGPVMCSHTGLESLKASPRNIPADLAREIFRRKGVVGVTCWRHLLGKTPVVSNSEDTSGSTHAQPPHSPHSPRSEWTRAYCATAMAFKSLSTDAGVAVGSDRGAPIHAPSWFYSPDHLSEMSRYLNTGGWSPGDIQAFFSGNARDFTRSLPA